MKFITNKFKILQKRVISYFTDPDFDSEHAFAFMELGFKFLGKISRHCKSTFSQQQTFSGVNIFDPEFLSTLPI